MSINYRMELLAHVSAPTSRKQDEKYRRQAHNYFIGEGWKRRRFQHAHVSGDDNGKPVTEVGHAPSAIPIHSPGVGGEDFATYIDDTQLAISGLESQLITSSLRRALESEESLIHSAGLAREDQNASRRDVSRSSSKESAGVSDHPASNQAGPENSYPTDASTAEISVFVPRGHDGVATVQRSGPAGSESEPDPVSVNGDREAVQKPSGSSSWSDDNLPYELPSTFSISDEMSRDSHGHAIARDKGSMDQEANLNTSSHGEAKTQSQGSPAGFHTKDAGDRKQVEHTSSPEGAAIHNHETRTPIPETVDTDIQSTTQAPGPSRLKSAVAKSKVAESALVDRDSAGPAAQIASRADQIEEPVALALLPLLVRPPPPPTSIALAPASFITQALQNLIDMPQMKGRYRPTSNFRDIRPRERGHWSFKTDSAQWTSELEVEMWHFLTRIIESGDPGWGVWMARAPSGLANDTESPAQPERLGQVRVFCWGEIAEHIWLLLYVASKSKIKRAGAVWIDASGAIVIRT